MDAVDKMSFLEVLRKDTVYPAFRSVIRAFVILGYLVGALDVVVALFMIAGGNVAMGFVELVFAPFIFFGAKVFAESASMLADVADALVETGARASSTRPAATESRPIAPRAVASLSPTAPTAPTAPPQTRHPVTADDLEVGAVLSHPEFGVCEVEAVEIDPKGSFATLRVQDDGGVEKVDVWDLVKSGARLISRPTRQG